MKTTKDDPISPQQLKALHVSFKRIGMDEENRHNYIHHFTGGRTCSSKDHSAYPFSIATTRAMTKRSGG